MILTRELHRNHIHRGIFLYPPPFLSNYAVRSQRGDMTSIRRYVLHVASGEKRAFGQEKLIALISIAIAKWSWTDLINNLASCLMFRRAQYPSGLYPHFPRKHAVATRQENLVEHCH